MYVSVKESVRTYERVKFSSDCVEYGNVFENVPDTVNMYENISDAVNVSKNVPDSVNVSKNV